MMMMIPFTKSWNQNKIVLKKYKSIFYKLIEILLYTLKFETRTTTFKMIYLNESHSNVDEVTLNGFDCPLQNVII